MIEYLTVAAFGIVFIVQYVYILGKLSANIHGCQTDITWIRDFLLTKCISSTHFSQESPMEITNELKELIPSSWKNTLDSANIDIQKCNNPFDCVVQISNHMGLIRMKKQAEEFDIDFNSLLIASGIYLYNQKNEEGK